MSAVRGEGTSKKFSFDEAFAAAREELAKKRPAPSGAHDWLFQCKVVEIGARVGGVAGFHEMYVIVE